MCIRQRKTPGQWAAPWDDLGGLFLWVIPSSFGQYTQVCSLDPGSIPRGTAFSLPPPARVLRGEEWWERGQWSCHSICELLLIPQFQDIILIFWVVALNSESTGIKYCRESTSSFLPGLGRLDCWAGDMKYGFYSFFHTPLPYPLVLSY